MRRPEKTKMMLETTQPQYPNALSLQDVLELKEGETIYGCHVKEGKTKEGTVDFIREYRFKGINKRENNEKPEGPKWIDIEYDSTISKGEIRNETISLMDHGVIPYEKHEPENQVLWNHHNYLTKERPVKTEKDDVKGKDWEISLIKELL